MSGMLLVLLVAAGSFGAGPEAPPAVEATLTVRPAAGRSTYAIGELIPLELEFRGRADPDYYLSTAAYGPGPMGTEHFAITPAGGFDDPLAEFFSSVGIVGSVLSGWHPLDGSPFVLRVYLNEWVRFTKPGSYRLVVESTRLDRCSREPAPTLTSSPVTLHVETPTPEWAAAEVARAVAALEGRGPGTLREGVAILRHLGTKDAALALVGHYGTVGRDARLDWLAGLVASPHRAEIVEAMEARVDAGDPLPPGFARDVALLRSFLDRPEGSYAERFERQKAAECDYARRSVEAVARRDRWSSIAGPWIRPALEALYAQWRGDWRFPGAGDAALRRLVELAPSTGRSLALEEIRSGAHGLVPETLTSLIGATGPDLDDALRQRYRASREEEGRVATMWLIARYGSARLLPLVRVEIDRDPFCALEAAAIAYLLEHDPPPALRRLQPGFDRRRSGMCAVPPWSDLAPRHWDEAVEAAAIAHLRGGNPRLVSDAAQILEAHGSARAKGSVLERLARWNEEWGGRKSELAALGSGPLSLSTRRSSSRTRS